MAKKPKILIITYYWSPAGGPAVQRWLNFVKHLPKNGWEPIVYVPKDVDYPIVDFTLFKDLKGMQFTKISSPIKEPYRWAKRINPQLEAHRKGQIEEVKDQSWGSKLALFIRGNFFIPDAKKAWVRPSVAYLSNYLEKENIQAIVTSGPPHSLHLIGLALKEKFPEIQWLADFRDPWTDISYHKQLKLLPFAKKKHLKLEQEVLGSADLIISTSDFDKERYQKKGAKRVVSITNGFSEEKNATSERNKVFTLSYIGGLEMNRNPSYLWSALEELKEEGLVFHLVFCGNIASGVLKELKEMGLMDQVEDKGYLPLAKANRLMEESDLLLLTNFKTEEGEGIIPGKLFEYLACKKPILSLGFRNKEVSRILKETESGKHFSEKETKEMKAFIEKNKQQWLAQKLSPVKEIEGFSRENLTKKLVEELNQLFSPKD